MEKANKKTFKKYERLTSKKDIDNLYKNGNTLKVFPFFVKYLTVENSGIKAKILISVPKKKFKKAVDRNRIKRLTREAYRLNKEILAKCLADKNLHIAFTYIHTEMPDFKIVSEKIRKSLILICEELNSFFPEKS